MILKIPVKITEKFGSVRKSVVKNMLITLQGIFYAKSVNLSEVKDELPQILKKETSPSGNYKRLIRFLYLLKDPMSKVVSVRCTSKSLSLILCYR